MDFDEFKRVIGDAFPTFPTEFNHCRFDDRYTACISFFAASDHENPGGYTAEISYDTDHKEFAIYLEVDRGRLTQSQAIKMMQSLLNGPDPLKLEIEDPNRPLCLGD